MPCNLTLVNENKDCLNVIFYNSRNSNHNNGNQVRAHRESCRELALSMELGIHPCLGTSANHPPEFMQDHALENGQTDSKKSYPYNRWHAIRGLVFLLRGPYQILRKGFNDSQKSHRYEHQSIATHFYKKSPQIPRACCMFSAKNQD